jgi:hypothetical protein
VCQPLLGSPPVTGALQADGTDRARPTERHSGRITARLSTRTVHDPSLGSSPRRPTTSGGGSHLVRIPSGAPGRLVRAPKRHVAPALTPPVARRRCGNCRSSVSDGVRTLQHRSRSSGHRGPAHGREVAVARAGLRWDRHRNRVSPPRASRLWKDVCVSMQDVGTFPLRAWCPIAGGGRPWPTGSAYPGVIATATRGWLGCANRSR